MKKHLSTIILVLIFFVGLSVLLYPTISNYWNSRVQSKAIIDYEAAIKKMDKKDFEHLFKEAEDYNVKVSNMQYPLIEGQDIEGYDNILNVTGTGIIGYITIDKINVELPIYHGISKEVLNVAAGHLPGSSFPIGGKGNHAVLSAHRGLPSAKLFTNLDKMEVGDTFNITVLDRVLTYKVDQILIVEPEKVEDLYVKRGEDYCTLMTCTPYGVNTHRLLVRGVRTDTIQEKSPVLVTSEAYVVDPLIVTPLVAAPILLLLFIILLIKYRKRKE